MKNILIENINSVIGENSKENWKLLENTKPEYLFFHLSSFPSCYVIYESKEIPNIEIIKQLAILCKKNTKYKNIPNLKVDYTLCNNIIKGEIEGEIYYKSNKKVKKIIV